MRWVRFPQAGTVPVERSSHSITVVGDKVFLFGGEHDPRVPIGSDLYEYSIADGTWRVVDAKGEPPSPRVAHAAAAVGQTLYVFGGRSGLAMGEGASNDLYAFDTATRTWTPLEPTGDLPPKRSYHAMTAVGDKLYVFGGCGEEGRLNDLYEYDTRTNSWRKLATPPADTVPGRGGTCLLAGGDQRVLYVIGGFCGRELDDTHFYRIAEDAWCGPSCTSCSPPAAPEPATAAPTKLAARSVFGGGTHTCGRSNCNDAGALLVYGGEVDPSDKGHDGAGDFCSSLQAYGEYFGGKGTGWRAVEAGGESPGPRGWFASCTLPDGRLLVHGGLDGNNQRLGDMFALEVHAE